MIQLLFQSMRRVPTQSEIGHTEVSEYLFKILSDIHFRLVQPSEVVSDYTPSGQQTGLSQRTRVIAIAIRGDR